VVVDDNRDAAESFARLLAIMDCEATFVTDPHDALAEIIDKRPHIVFLDIGMPGIGGYELASMVRQLWLGQDKTGCGDRIRGCSRSRSSNKGRV